MNIRQVPALIVGAVSAMASRTTTVSIPTFRPRSSVLLLLALALMSQVERADADLQPVLVKDILPGPGDGFPDLLANVDGTLLFKANDGVHGEELWRSDGTAEGTMLVKDINQSGSSGIQRTTVIDGTLFFTAFDGVHGFELWRSDGTETGTFMVKDIRPGSANSNVQDLTAVAGTLFFVASDGVSGGELWKSDGTEEGTVLVKDISPGSASSFLVGNTWLTAVGDTLFFNARNSTLGGEGRELWKSDGTAEGTVRLTDFHSTTSTGPSVLTAAGNTLFFVTIDPVTKSGQRLWKSDGTPGGTVVLNPGDGVHSPTVLTDVDGILFFSAIDLHGRELWKSDGTPEGTLLVKDIFLNGDSAPTQIVNLNGTLLFAARENETGRELWKSDGTEEGTVLVKDIVPLVQSSDPSQFAIIGGTLFFSATEDLHGRELWMSDGTEAGTVLVDDINPFNVLGGGNSNPSLLTGVNGTVFFRADDGASGIELWKVDVDEPNVPATLSLTPQSATKSVGAQHCVIATVLDQNNDPLEGSSVSFRIGGANPSVTDAEAVTDQNGEAPFCYTGENEGADTIEACAAESPVDWVACAAADVYGSVAITWETVTPPAEADLELTLSGEPPDLVPAQTTGALLITAIVRNLSTQDEFTGVMLTVRLPGGVNLDDFAPNAGICSAKGRDLTCAIGNLAPEAQFEMTIVIGTKGGSALTTVATVTAIEPEQDLSNNDASLTVQVCRRGCL